MLSEVIGVGSDPPEKPSTSAAFSDWTTLGRRYYHFLASPLRPLDEGGVREAASE